MWTTREEKNFLAGLGRFYNGPEQAGPRTRLTLLRGYLTALDTQPPRSWDSGVDPQAVRECAERMLLEEELKAAAS